MVRNDDMFVPMILDAVPTGIEPHTEEKTCHSVTVSASAQITQLGIRYGSRNLFPVCFSSSVTDSRRCTDID